MLKEMQEIGKKHPISSIPFEAFYDGSWHAVDILRIRWGKTYIMFDHWSSKVENEICADNIRLRSRKSNSHDCSHLLKVGVDVCVLSTRPISGGLDEQPQPNFPLWYDAKIISKKTLRHHDGRCSCLFSVILYRERAFNGTGKNVLFERAEMVTIDRIAILQKLEDEPQEHEFDRWSFTEDCISSARSKLIGGIFSSEISWLVVLSIQKGISFDVKVLQRNIVYQILNRNPVTGMKIMCFHGFNETLRPVVRSVDLFLVKETAAEAALKVFVEPDCNGEMEVDSESDVEVLYDCMSLRRSKRQKVKPRRFTSFYSPDFDRTARNSGQIVEILDQSPDEKSDSVEVEQQLVDNWEICPAERSSDEDYEFSPVSDRKKTFDWKVKEGEPQLLLTMGDEIGEIQPGDSPDRLTQDSSEKPAQRPRGRPRKSDRRTPLRNGNPLYKKRYSYRKKLLLSAAECELLIKQCMGTIEDEIETEVEAGSQPEKTFVEEEEEDFKWSPASKDPFEIDENEDLWKEMENTLTVLALLEQQEMDSETFDDGKVPLSCQDGDQACKHDFKLDEQIGIICQLCNFVHTKIRDVMPQFVMSENWNLSREQCGKLEFSIMDTYSLDPSSFDDPTTNFDMASLGGEDNVWALIPELKLKLYTHQKKAFEFIWRNIAGSLKPKEMDIRSAETGGCVISHSPGSGKTLLLISFIISYLKLFPRSRPLIVAPKITVYVWRKEFEKWGVQFPLHIIHPAQSFQKANLDWKFRVSSMEHRKPNRKMRHLVDCMSKFQQWHKESSVLLMSYSSFFLMQKESKDEHRKFMAKVLRNSPGLLILDEGHNPRSTISKLRKILMEVNTKSRILLSGTLFQNNFEEYFNTLCLARPSFVDDVLGELDREKLNTYKKSEKRSKRKERMARKLFVQRIGEKIESDMEDDRKLGFDALNKITNGFMDIYEDDNSGRLPGLVIYTIVLLPADIQREVLVRLQSCLKLTRRYPIELELLITVGSIHPWLIKTMAHAEDYFNNSELEKIEKYKDSVISGSKVKFVFDIVHKSIMKGEKVLIFSHNIPPISLLVRYFETFLGWRKGEEVLVLQGDQELSLRAKIMDTFNGDVENKCKVLIASTSACAEGISLTAASRVVLLDSEWNHSKTRQAIARAFRPGQERKVYVYKLLASGTWEEDKYRSNDWKAWLSKMISMGQYIEHNSCREVDVVEDEILTELQEEDQGKMFQMIMEQN
ncbi:SNF2 domain-containing protein CLASSY 1-like [Phalaenopsis equestris]|uniref:SNF2 domain-containing protein CLASSY 1-like n=1 Tax=Phalaenopsis equestris TaxID=78828 RepID=UPI0009E45477|nr:SNF2 domain-containing protein CLASSY 1-like [Phalaenopsis equestris]